MGINKIFSNVTACGIRGMGSKKLWNLSDIINNLFSWNSYRCQSIELHFVFSYKCYTCFIIIGNDSYDQFKYPTSILFSKGYFSVMKSVL